jgi:hypothetical protein
MRLFLLIIFAISGCAAPEHFVGSGNSSDAAKGVEARTSDSDAVLEKIELLLKHANLEDDAYVSKTLDVRLAGGELESGHGDMIYECALQAYTNIRNWTGRRYRYESGPAYFAPPPFPAASKCFNPYVIDETNPAHIAASLNINLNYQKICITLSDIKRHFGDAYYSESRGGFSMLYRTGNTSNHIAVRIESTRTGKICARVIVLDQNDFSPEFF